MPTHRYTSRLRHATAAACLLAAAVIFTGCGRNEQPTPETPAEPPIDVGLVDPIDPPAPAAPVSTGPLRVVMNAELAGEISGAMRVAEFEGAAGGKCVYIPLGEGATPDTAGKMSFSLVVPADKTVQFWVRCYWTGTCANSVTLQVPGYPDHIIGEDQTYSAWHWVKGPALPLEAGTHTITLVQREDDVRFDQILATSNSRVKPMGIEE